MARLVSRLIVAGLLSAGALGAGASPAGQASEEAQELEEFVPTEEVPADNAVAFPVDI